MKKTLILLRHAKAEAGADDHARKLAERGVEEAKAIGAYMEKQGVSPQKILCSTSTRTRQTLELAIGSWQMADGKKNLSANCQFLDAVYNASENQHLQNIAAVADDISSLMIIAHNPGLHQLAIHLSREGEAASRRQLAMEFPPCSLVVIELGDIRWSDIFTARGTLKYFVTPKTI